LEDLATFLTWYKQQRNATNAPVITYGGSYSGALSAWFRNKYPQLTVGAVASSGVVDAVLDFTMFDIQGIWQLVFLLDLYALHCCVRLHNTLSSSCLRVLHQMLN